MGFFPRYLILGVLYCYLVAASKPPLLQMMLFSKVEEMLKTAEALLGDLSGFRSFRKDASDLLDELVNWRQDTFDEWSRDVQAQMEDERNTIWSVR